MEDCPIPAVGEALSPYIESRENVSAIRRSLHDYLESQLAPQDAPLSPINLPLPAAAPRDTPPAALTGVRRAYWKALQAHAAAQAKHDALRAELEQLKHSKSGSGGNVESLASTTINESYVPLLRQREKQRKLKAIEKACSDVIAAGDDLSTSSLEDVVKRQLGEAPTPPSAQPSDKQNSEVDAQLLELKKTLISTNRSINERRKALLSHQANSPTTISPQAHIAGLQAALQELTIWMETQLTIIAESEGKTEISENTENSILQNRTIPTANIEALYSQYLESRTRLIHSIKNPPTTNPETPIEDFTFPATTSKDSKPSTKTSAEIVLPYIPTLLAGKQHESSLLQQSAYTRQRISSTEAETENLIRRLAGESHLVQPGASRGEDWAKAAEAAGEATEKAVDERVEAGQSSIESAQVALKKILTLPESVESVAD